MADRIGLVQTGGIGDIIIALPIADHFTDLGHEVVWPIREEYVPSFERARPGVKFMPVAPCDDLALHEPLRILNAAACDRTIVLYSFLHQFKVYDPRLSASLKFDEYKYAIAGVPFAKKWELRIERDMDREQRLFDSLGISEDYVCYHGQSSDLAAPLSLPPRLADGMQVVEMTKRSDDESPFDWLLTLERASKLILIDSCFANLVDQLDIGPAKRTFILKNPVPFTPVLKNGWSFMHMESFLNRQQN